MEPIVANMDHKAICYDISNIMMTVIMVAGNSNVENNFREGKSSLLDFGTHIAGFGQSHASFFKFRCSFFISCGYLILATCLIAETRTSE